MKATPGPMVSGSHFLPKAAVVMGEVDAGLRGHITKLNSLRMQLARTRDGRRKQS